VDDLIIASEAMAAGLVTRQQLRTKYVKLHHNVYAPVGMPLDATDRARAAWLWSRRKATLVGSSAAAMHRTLWLPDDAPAELAHANQPSPPGIVIHRGSIADDEVCLRASIDCTTPARTAYDIGRRIPGDMAIIRIDALLNATRCTVQDVGRIADRYPGARGIRRLRATLDLADGGANRPKRPSFGCYSCATDWRGQRLKSKSANVVSTWGGRNGRSVSSTTENNLGPIQASTPMTSSGWNTLQRKDG
jgi:hypothetical protein